MLAGTDNRVLWMLVALALGIRIIIVTANWGDTQMILLHPDSFSYVATAESLADPLSISDDSGRPTWGRAPGYPVLLAILFATRVASPVRLEAIVVIQVLLSLLIVIAVVGLAHTMGGVKAAAFSAAILALEPSSVAYPNLALSETFFSLLLLAAILCWWRWLRKPILLHLIISGATFGLLPLIRPSAQYLPPVLAILVWWFTPMNRRRWLTAAIFLAVSVCPTAAWSARNLSYHGVATIDYRTGRAKATFARHVEDLAGIERPPAAFGPYPWEQTFAQTTESSAREVMRIRTEYFLTTLRRHPVASAARFLRTGIEILASPDSKLPYMILRKVPSLGEGYLDRIRWLARLQLVGVWLLFGIVVTVAAFACLPLIVHQARHWDRSQRALLTLIIILMFYLIGVSSFVAHQAERYRVPVIPLCAVVLALGLASRKPGPRTFLNSPFGD